MFSSRVQRATGLGHELRPQCNVHPNCAPNIEERDSPIEYRTPVSVIYEGPLSLHGSSFLSIRPLPQHGFQPIFESEIETNSRIGPAKPEFPDGIRKSDLQPLFLTSYPLPPIKPSEIPSLFTITLLFTCASYLRLTPGRAWRYKTIKS